MTELYGIVFSNKPPKDYTAWEIGSEAKGWGSLWERPPPGGGGCGVRVGDKDGSGCQSWSERPSRDSGEGPQAAPLSPHLH